MSKVASLKPQRIEEFKDSNHRVSDVNVEKWCGILLAFRRICRTWSTCVSLLDDLASTGLDKLTTNVPALSTPTEEILPTITGSHYVSTATENVTSFGKILPTVWRDTLLYVDRFLSLMAVEKTKIQLVCTAAMFIAPKCKSSAALPKRVNYLNSVLSSIAFMGTMFCARHVYFNYTKNVMNLDISEKDYFVMVNHVFE